MQVTRLVLAAVAMLLPAGATNADVFNMGPGLTSMEMVRIADAGNAADTEAMITDGTTGYGSVNYDYSIGKYEVTAGQYTEFLNAVAKTDTYGLFTWHMDTNDTYYGCNIKRTGSSGSYSYSVAADWANRPVNFVSWGDTARFVNWLTNGQRVGDQDDSTTENGSYALNGATTEAELMAVTRTANAKYCIPTENEWYKAAYYDPNKPGETKYWDFATKSNTVPSNVFAPNGSNNANYTNDYNARSIGAPYLRTEVGAFVSSPGPYGTFDQDGNVWEWNEAAIGSNRGVRGGSFDNFSNVLRASYRYSFTPTSDNYNFGFRVVAIPEPATMAFLAFGFVGMLKRRRGLGR